MRDTFILGDSNSTCDRCGFEYKRSRLRKEWSGAVVCSSCFETRHPQDLIKPRAERQTTQDPRVVPAYRFLGDNEITREDL